MLKIDKKEYAKRLLKLDNILILSHSHPDGDTIGTGIAHLNALTLLGKKAILACTDELPDHISFLAQYTDSERCFFGRSFDGVIRPKNILSVDVATTSLIGKGLSEYAKKIDLALDHHEINTLDVPFLHVVPDMSSAGEVLYNILVELEAITEKQLIDKNSANALYAAIASDSGSFKFSSTTGNTMRAAGLLIDRGADSAYISKMLFDTRTLDSYKAEALCVKNLEFFCDGRLVFSYMKNIQAVEEDIALTEFDNCIQLLRTLVGVEVAVFAKEKLGDNGNQQFRLSMRSNEYFDVSEICALFDGGGHKHAAGCTIEGELELVKQKVIDVLRERL